MAEPTEILRVPETIEVGESNVPTRVIKNPRVEIIDVFRFFAALWVMLGHAGYFPLLEGVTKEHLGGLIARGIYNNLFCGPAAVIVFFVISGYCIHRPFRAVGRLPLLHYFTRRFVRILFPMTFAIIFARPVGVPLRLFNETILWSLLAELIYYSIYPILRIWARPLGWKKLIIGAYVAAFILVLLNPYAPSYASFGTYLNWLMGLPCWLLGCLLAEHDPTSTRQEKISLSEIWGWRMGIWALATACSALHFHSPLRYPWTLNLFALPVYVWLRKEIEFHQHHPTSQIFAWAGLWTYSLYLTHEITFAAYIRLPVAHLSTRLNWCFSAFAMLLGAYLFYLVFEKPGHLLARRLARIFDPRLVVKQNRI